MTESNVKQVKVDNWGIYFLQRLKHFFNRTDYCDLTLQFQDNAQLKVHRLVLSACTEYFELLERTCEMYEDCLIMPDDLQADVVVPIVNFMYTGQLEFQMDLLERLYQTSQIMNMPVLTKLLDAHRNQIAKTPKTLNLNPVSRSNQRSYSKTEPVKNIASVRQIAPASSLRQIASAPSSSTSTNKRSYTKAFGVTNSVPKEKKQYQSTLNKPQKASNNGIPFVPPSVSSGSTGPPLKVIRDPRPTRYELPEELDTGNIFDNSFTNISYTSEPLMVHPETTKRYPSRKGLFGEPSNSKKFSASTMEIVECKKLSRNDNIFDDETPIEQDVFQTTQLKIKNEPKVSNQLFDQIIEENLGPKVTIETKDTKTNNMDHAKIISEVLKKYPHLVKSNKNIKLKIVNTPSILTPTKSKKQQISPTSHFETPKQNNETPDFTYETDVLDSKEAAKLIALGAENIKGPWICLICGTPGRALHFTSYYKFRRHLVEVHDEKPVASICEYCGLRSLKRNYLLHHLYTKHGVEPPASYHFPKCNLCNYVALTEGFLIKHKAGHVDNRNFRCNVCASTYNTSTQLLAHIQSTGHKYSAERKTNLQCIYCLKVFLREANLYAHIKTHHKATAKADGIIDDSDEEKLEEVKPTFKSENYLKYENNIETEYEESDSGVETQYQIRPDGNIQLVTKKPRENSTSTKQKILNAGFSRKPTQKPTPQKFVKKFPNIRQESVQHMDISNNSTHNEEIVIIDNNEYIMKDNQLIPRNEVVNNEEFLMTDVIQSESDHTLTPSTSMDYTNINNTLTGDTIQEQKMIIKKATNMNQPIQIVVSNEDEYKALMNSNHSIIFEDASENKTLTVLSTAHDNDSNIDLDHTQSNDMMIIPQNYPINVTESLPADNNIVVVYSHPVDNPNKQYQLITSQDIGAQFVQSSAVITQNYDTMNTSTPVMSAHVIDTQTTDSWQHNIQDIEHVQVSAVPELQEMAIIERTELSATNETDDTELPEVTLTSIQPQENLTQSVEENLIQSIDINTEDLSVNTEMAVVEEINNISSTSMDIEVLSEKMPQDDTGGDNEREDTTANEIIEQENINPEVEITTDEVVDEQNTAQIITTETVEECAENIEENEKATEENIEESQNLEVTEAIAITAEEEPENSPELSVDLQSVNVDNEEIKLPSVAKEQIQSLASEWSEDEYDNEPQESNDTQDNPKINEIENEPAVQEELEESIENIQQEIEKQMSSSITEPAPEGETDGSINSSQEDNVAVLSETQTDEPAVLPQEKISSLLNDWEDNDSREGNDSTNGNDNIEESTTVVEESNPVTTEGENTVDEKQEQKEDDKIKNLVSDWDDIDDEEENKS